MIADLMQILVVGLMLGGIYALVSIGLTMIFGVIRIVNFAHGEFLMMAMYITFGLNLMLHIDPYVSIIVVAPLLFITGMLIQKFFIQPILNSPSNVQIFVTLGLSIVLQNLALMLFKADYRTIKTAYQTAVVHVGPLLISCSRLIAFLVAVAITLLLFAFLKWTYKGKAIRAVALNRSAAALMGINVHHIYTLAFGIGAALVGVAGAMLMPIYYVFPTVGGLFTLTAFVVVVLGGLGSIGGAFLGGLIIGVVEALAGAFIDPGLKEAVYFAIFILILVFRPAGLFGMGRGSEEVGSK